MVEQKRSSLSNLQLVFIALRFEHSPFITKNLHDSNELQTRILLYNMSVTSLPYSLEDFSTSNLPCLYVSLCHSSFVGTLLENVR